MANDNPKAPRPALFSLPEWDVSGFEEPETPRAEPPQSADKFLVAMSAPTGTAAPRDADAERDFLEAAQRESIAADERRGGTGSQDAICLDTGLPDLDSDLVTLDSGLFDTSKSGSFEFSGRSSVVELTSGMLDLSEPGAGGVTDAVNAFTAAAPPPLPPQPQAADPQEGLAKRDPEDEQASENSLQPTRIGGDRPAKEIPIAGPELTNGSGADAGDGGRYASTTRGHERVATRPVKIKVRQD